MMGETVAQTICGTKTEYKPGIWFNSAKFFDIEYQVYGNVPSEINYPLDSKIWIHTQEKKSVRIVFQADTKIVVGFNLIGIRFRHEICDQWIAWNYKSLNELFTVIEKNDSIGRWSSQQKNIKFTYSIRIFLSCKPN